MQIHHTDYIDQEHFPCTWQLFLHASLVLKRRLRGRVKLLLCNLGVYCSGHLSIKQLRLLTAAYTTSLTPTRGNSFAATCHSSLSTRTADSSTEENSGCTCIAFNPSIHLLDTTSFHGSGAVLLTTGSYTTNHCAPITTSQIHYLRLQR